MLVTLRLDQLMLYNHITLSITIHSFRWVNWEIQTLTEKKVDLETKNLSNFTPLMITLSTGNWRSWKSQRSLTYRKLEHHPLQIQRAVQKWPKPREPLGMRAMPVFNDIYTASSITSFLKFLSVNKVVKASSGLSIFQITRLLQLLTPVISELWRILWVIYWPPWNEPGLNCKTKTEQECNTYLLDWNCTLVKNMLWIRCMREGIFWYNSFSMLFLQD